MNTKMFEKDNYFQNRITCPFADDRKYMKISGYNFHEGVDYSSNNLQLLNIFNQISGLVEKKNVSRVYGKYIKIRHNPAFSGGVNEMLYSQYCHLSEFSEKIKEHHFVNFGEKLGIMGNTGNSTGIHLHLMFFQMNIKKSIKTELLKDIIEKLKINDNKENYFYQQNYLFFNPEIIYKYFNFLQN